MIGESTNPGQPSSADLALRAQLLDRHGVETVRFIWHSDATGRLTKLSPELEMITGLPSANLLGQLLSQFIQAQDYPLNLALHSQASLIGIVAVWPLSSARAWIPSSLGAIRTIDIKGVVSKVRGFGLLHLNQAFIQQDLKVTAQESSHQTLLASFDSLSTNVIPLRPLSKSQRQKIAQETVLSDAELSAFNEIARALTDENSIDEKHAFFSSQPSADKSLSQDRRGIDLTDLLECLPIGVIISRRKELLFVNKFLLNEFGYSHQDVFINDGGLTKVFGAYDLENLINTTKFIREDLEASALIFEWDGAPATIIFILKKVFEMDRAQHRIPVISEEAPDVLIGADDFVLNTETNLSDEIAVIISADGRIEHMTPPFSRLFIGKKVCGDEGHFASFFKPETREVLLQAIGRIRGGGKEALELIGYDDVESFDVFLSCKPQTFDKIYVSLKRKTQQLHAARPNSKNLDDNIFLEKRTKDLLTVIKSTLAQNELLSMDRFECYHPEFFHKKIKNIRSSIIQSLSYIDDYFKQSQSLSSTNDHFFSNIEINELLAECVEQIQFQARQKRVVMRLALAAEPIFIQSCAPSLRRILLKILANAVEFNILGGQVIISTAISDNQTVSIKIKDTGVGMSEEEVTAALGSLSKSTESGQTLSRNAYFAESDKLIEKKAASFSIVSEKKQGTLIKIVFPLSNLSAAE